MQRTDAELGTLLEGLWSRKQELDKVQAAVVRDARQSYVREASVPKELAQRLAKLKTDAYGVRCTLLPSPSLKPGHEQRTVCRTCPPAVALRISTSCIRCL